MRESYRDKRNRQARINREKEDNRFINRRKTERRKLGDRREYDRRIETKGTDEERRTSDRRVLDRRQTERRVDYDRRDDGSDADYDDIVAGRNAVLELLKSDKDINKIFIENGDNCKSKRK